MSDFVIRLAKPRDAAEISAVGTAAFHAAYDGTATADSIARHVETHFGAPAVSREIPDARVTYLVAMQGTKCAGFIKLRESAAPEPVTAARPLEVQQLYVEPGRQRSGVGRRLLEFARAVAREQGYDGLWLSVWTEADWATSFYRRCGFVPLGQIPFRLDDTEFVDYLMWLPQEAS